jgi:hypothetical protein
LDVSGKNFEEILIQSEKTAILKTKTRFLAKFVGF